MTNHEDSPKSSPSAEELNLRAYEELKAYVAGETLGSLKYNALLDCAQFCRLTGKFYLDHVNEQPSEPPVVAAYGALSETIRTRMFDRDAQEYSSAFSEASDILNSFAAASVASLEEMGIVDKGEPLNRGMHDAGNTVIATIRRDEGLPRQVFNV